MKASYSLGSKWGLVWRLSLNYLQFIYSNDIGYFNEGAKSERILWFFSCHPSYLRVLVGGAGDAIFSRMWGRFQKNTIA